MGFLDGLAMIALRIRKTKEAFLEKITAERQENLRWKGKSETHSFSFQKAKAIFWRP